MAEIARRHRRKMLRSTFVPFSVLRTASPSQETTMTLINRTTTLVAVIASAFALALPACRATQGRRTAQDRLRLREPDRRRRLDVPARHRPQGNGEGAGRQGDDQVHRERARGCRRRARDPRAGGHRPQPHLHDVVRLHESDDQGRADLPQRTSSSTRRATRRRRTSASTTRASTKAAISRASSPARCPRPTSPATSPRFRSRKS